jgi:hypothetical protein
MNQQLSRVTSLGRRTTMRRAAPSWCLALLLGACGSDDKAPPVSGAGGEGSTVSCENDRRADAYTSPMTKASISGKVKVTLLASEPAPPSRGDNTWQIRITDDTGSPLAGAPVTVTPFMPDHGHGTPIPTVVSGGSDGVYEVTPLNLFMPGVWRITVSGALDENPNDDVVFFFCVVG